jgi:hypothetical protein
MEADHTMQRDAGNLEGKTGIDPLADLSFPGSIKDANSTDFTTISTDSFIILACIFCGDGVLEHLAPRDSGSLLQGL